ncbi:MAG: hypothetical protein NT166_32500 [Candidatus Aminicenantes bacterium]|nr:hypothetical protein [Candidatus Aminicenantes bacterium]
MNKTKIIILIVFIAFLAYNLYPLFIANESPRGFQPGNPLTANAGNATSTLNQYVIEGGGYYLKSDSDFLLFLNKVEMAGLNGLNYDEALRIVNSAVDNLEKARATYFKLTNLADVTPYDLVVQAQLVSFDYTDFQEGKGFNPIVFKAVEGFLSKGDIRGVYHKLYNDVSEILSRLYRVKAGLEKSELTAISDLWDIHQHYADSIFFGQYTAAVFFEIK